MLGSAQRSVPTTKQFRQPYFMAIGNFLDLFSRIGKTGIHWILSPQHPSDELATHVSRDGKLSYLITAIRYGFFVLDNHFKVKLWNHEAERLTRLPAAEMVGRSIWEMIPEWSDKHIRQSFHQAFNNKMTVTVDPTVHDG